MGRTAIGLLLVAVTLMLGACGGDDDEAGEQGGDVFAACDRLEELGLAVLDAREAQTADEVAAAVDRPTADFTEAAAGSADQELAALADSYQQAYTTYLAGGVDAQEAGNEADIALDQAAARCTELGATNNFPEEPG